MPKVSDLFSSRYGHSLELLRLTPVAPPAGVNFVGRAGRNNGVTARVMLPKGVSPGAGGELTVALGGQGGVLSTFVQPEPFVCGRDVMILNAIDSSMTLSEKLWWARCIYANRYRYSFGRQANRSLAELSLPDGLPDFVTVTDIPPMVGAAESLAPTSDLPPIASWGSWRLDELFAIKKGRRLIARERRTGSTPFIGTSTKHNGIVGYTNSKPLFAGRSISVPYNGQGGVGYAFYQPRPFCASDDVQVLVPPEDVDAGGTVVRLLHSTQGKVPLLLRSQVARGADEGNDDPVAERGRRATELASDGGLHARTSVCHGSARQSSRPGSPRLVSRFSSTSSTRPRERDGSALSKRVLYFGESAEPPLHVDRTCPQAAGNAGRVGGARSRARPDRHAGRSTG